MQDLGIYDNTFVEYLKVEIDTKVRMLVYFMEWLEIIEVCVTSLFVSALRIDSKLSYEYIIHFVFFVY